MTSFKVSLSLARLYKSKIIFQLNILNVAPARVNINQIRHITMEMPKLYRGTVINNSLTYHQKEDNSNTNRTLVLLFAWMLAKDKHLDKFNKIYANYDFDVLFIKCSPLQLLFPKNGSVKNAQQVCDFLVQNKNLYSNILVHGFSVGGYQFGEVLAQMTHNDQYKKAISPLVKGCIFDSAADLNAIPRGLAKALTSNSILRRIIFALLNLHLRLFHNFATIYYQSSQDEFYAMRHFTVPNLLLVSDIDQVGSIESNQSLVDAWTKNGSPTKMKVFIGSKHVSHYHKYKEEYEEELKQFIKSLKL